jgi:ribosomal protein L27
MGRKNKGEGGRKKGGARKIGRQARKGKDNALSAYVRGRISFEQYQKQKKK